MTDFCQRTKASGQLCFDFMLNAADGQLYAFECNPRTSTVLLEYHDHPAFADALYNPEARPGPPCLGAKRTSVPRRTQTVEHLSANASQPWCSL